MKLYVCDYYLNKIIEIKYKLIQFSDSQNQIVLTSDFVNTDIENVKIVSRLSWNDLQNIILAVKALKRLNVVNIYLEVPYMLGARSDRCFEDGSTHYLKDVICPIINSLEFKSVSVLDPHSNVLEACLDNFVEMSMTPFYDWFIEEALITTQDKQLSFIISPDYGAIKRTNFIAKEYGFEKVLNCSKIRDIKTGKILDTNIPITDFGKRNCIIVDDICDNGNTFINLAKELKERNAGKIILVVTHSIQENGLNRILNYIDEIYTTNSVNDYEINNVIVFNLF